MTRLHTESASGELREVIAEAIAKHHTGPVCVWCSTPIDRWTSTPCSAPDGDGHLRDTSHAWREARKTDELHVGEKS